MFGHLLLSFSNELTKVANDSWKEFEKGLKSKDFQSKQLSATDDPKLKKYIKNYGGVLVSKDLKAYVQSSSHPKKYHQVKAIQGGRFTCTCKDWQYSHSTKSTDCRHVDRYKRYLASLDEES